MYVHVCVCSVNGSHCLKIAPRLTKDVTHIVSHQQLTIYIYMYVLDGTVIWFGNIFIGF